jgi:RNA polymerase sigma-70 factor (ECF subfamily)
MQRELVERAIGGDHDAFAELARASINRLYATARLILRDESRAEDATQEALVSAWRDLSGLRDPERFEAWLHRVLVRACYREARRSRARGRIELHVAMPDLCEKDPGQALAERDELERGFRQLDAEQRTVLVLHYYLGLSLEEAAEALGVPAGTVKSRLHRAIQAMRAALDADARPGLAHGRPLA